jgi:hypothetical protein
VVQVASGVSTSSGGAGGFGCEHSQWWHVRRLDDLGMAVEWIAARSVQVVCRWVFEEIGVKRRDIQHSVGNRASYKRLVKAGSGDPAC